MKLSKKLTLSFMFSILLSIFIISTISNFMINSRFESYLVSERENKFERIYKEINNLLIDNHFKVDEMDLKHYALTEDINITIIDNENKVLYNSNTSMRMGMGMRNHKGMMNMHGMPKGNYAEKSYSLLNNTLKVGSLVIGYIDNAYLTESALVFKDTLGKSLLLSSIITIFISIAVSIYLSSNLTTPLVNIRNTAADIRKGNLDSRSKINTNTLEIKELSDSINYLGETLGKEEETRKKYASDISHELRTPLTTLKAHLEAIIDGVWDPNKEHLGILMSEISRLTNLVDDLKDSFNLKEDSMNINKTKFNISKELEDIITTFSPMYHKEGHEIKYSIEDHIEITMDKDKLNQIMVNLLSNSLRYLNNNGEVFVELKKAKEQIIIKVKDNGIGIKKEDLPFIFNRFYRADPSRDKSTGGTGLGLPIVKSIVEAHEGTINIDSVFGESTEIIISLPI